MATFGFIENIINEDLEKGEIKEIITRFPPEPNGFLHIGHGKAISVNFGIRDKFKGKCNLRFDDTNPSKENEEYVNSIIEDIKWLGYEPDNIFFASDYFEKMEEYAFKLIKDGKAFVCDLSNEEIKKYRGTLTTKGVNSPFRDRTIEENTTLFQEMIDGKYENGSKVLRLKIDMASPNINMRDPVIYRVLKEYHHHLKTIKNVYPMYDYAHPIEDALEGITHSLCSLEFENHRPLYDFILEQLDFPHKPLQREFARLNITNTVLSKRSLLKLVDEGHVLGWDDPRMPTIRGLRRRGYPKESLMEFISDVGVAKSNSTVDYRQLEAKVRENLNDNALRAMCVINPLKVIITNMDEDEEIEVFSQLNPEKEELGTRSHFFTKEIYIEQSDFMIEKENKKYRRFYPGNEVRLKDAFYGTCDDYVLNDDGSVKEIHVSIDKNTLGGWSEDGRKVKGTIHWVSCKYGIKGEVREYDHIFKDSAGEEININSKKVMPCVLEQYLGDDSILPETKFQFLRIGYFVKDKDSTKDLSVFNKIVGLKESFK